MKDHPAHIISIPEATIQRIVEAVGEHPPGETLMVEIETDARLSRIENKLCKTYPYSEFTCESFPNSGSVWAYIHINKMNHKKTI